MSLARVLGQRVYDARRLLGSGTRQAYREFQHGQSLRDDLWPRLALSSDDREAWVRTALHRIVRRAGKLPFWQRRFAAAGFDPQRDFSFADFALLPPLERADLAAGSQDLLDPAVSPDQRREMATGGSSGTPTVTWTGPEERGWLESGIAHFERRIGLRRGDRVAYLWGHNLDPVHRTSRREALEDWLLNRRWYDCFRLSPDTLAEYHRDLNGFRPRVLIAYASALASLAEAVLDQGLPAPAYPTLGFITGAEKLYPWQRALVERAFRKPVFERYGGRDIGLIACQLDPEQSMDFTVDWMNVYLEREHPGDESSILITKLHADAMPLLRYRTGDVGRFSSRDAMSRGPETILHEIVGRELQRVWRPDGTWMHGTVVPHLMKDFPVVEYQLRQRDDLSAELLLVPRGEFRPEHAAAIDAALRTNLPGVPFSIQYLDRVPRTKAGKLLPVVSEVLVERFARGASKSSSIHVG